METKQRKVIVLQGLQGSGKSTFAKVWANESPTSRVRVCRDDIRNMLGKYWVPERENLVTQIEYQTMFQSMMKGYDVVSDAMHLSEYSDDLIWDLVNTVNHLQREYSYSIEFKPFPTPIEECIKRDAKRENPIGKDIILATYERNKEFIKKIFGEFYE